MSKKVLTFPGGFKLPAKKELSRNAAISPLPPPARVVVPLSQHIGAPAICSVAVGQKVRAGECIAAEAGFISAHVHASISGIVSDICSVKMPNGRESQAVVIDGDGTDDILLMDPIADPSTADAATLLARVSDAGIVGLGGATFPSRVKLSVLPTKPVDTLLVNGAECEPYLTADYRLMMERADDIVAGIRILMRVVGVDRAVVGVEAHNHDAVDSMREAIGADRAIAVCPLKAKYPQGAEKMLIKAALNRVVPGNGGLPADVGVVVQNVGTACAVADAVIRGLPLISRVLTVSGEAIKHPANLRVRIGTSVADVVASCGGITQTHVTVLAGGPMMGAAMSTLDCPVVKGLSGVTVLVHSSETSRQEFQCLRCGKCERGCPMKLQPTHLSALSLTGDIDEAKRSGIMECCQCGLCSVVCPAGIQNSEIIRLFKAEVMKQSQKR